MSRIGKSPVAIPQGVEVKIDGTVCNVKGPKGELTQYVDPCIKVKVEDELVVLERESEAKDHIAKHGLYRALINNMVLGVTEGYKIELELVGVGYRASNQGQRLEIHVGFAHPIIIELPKEIKVQTETAKGQPPLIILESHDKQLVSQVAAKIRSYRKPEPYKGKGIKYKGEYIRRKAGKAAGAK